MSQNSIRVAKEAKKNPELLGSTNQDHADEQLEYLKDVEKQNRDENKRVREQNEEVLSGRKEGEKEE